MICWQFKKEPYKKDAFALFDKFIDELTIDRGVDLDIRPEARKIVLDLSRYYARNNNLKECCEKEFEQYFEKWVKNQITLRHMRVW